MGKCDHSMSKELAMEEEPTASVDPEPRLADLSDEQMVRVFGEKVSGAE